MAHDVRTGLPDDPMQAFAEYGTPGPEHAILAKRIGAWDLVVRFFHAPGLPPHESAGRSTYAWILGGRVLENVVTGGPAGRTFEGRGYLGFDTRLRRYWFVWFDSMGTGVMRGTGLAGSDGVSIEWSVEATDVMHRSIRQARSVEHAHGADAWLARSYDRTADGGEILRTEFVYRRAGG